MGKLIPLVTLAIMLTMVLGACGERPEPPPPPEEGAAPPPVEDEGAPGGKTAEQLTEETERLTVDVAGSVRRLADPAAREDALVQLDEQRERALALVDQAQTLPETERARARLVEANRSIADAASSLRDFAQSDNASALSRGRSALEGAEQELSRVAGDLGNRLTPELRERLKHLSERIPEGIRRP